MRIARAPFISNNGLRTLLRFIDVADVCAVRGRAARISSYRCGRLMSTAAAASDDARRVKRVRVSQKERRVLLESFVNKYRSLNAGKFPTTSVAKKEVGGCYYVIRKTLQELKYNSMHNPAIEINAKSLVERKGAEKEDIPPEELSQGKELSSSHSHVDRKEEGHLYEVEKVPQADENACKRNMQVSGDNVVAEMEKADSQIESTGGRGVCSQSLSKDFAGMADDNSTDQKLVCKEAESKFSIEHATTNLPSDEIKKHSESRKTLDVKSVSEKTLLEDPLNPGSEEDKYDIQVTSSSLHAKSKKTLPPTGKPVLVHEETAKSASYDGPREPSVESEDKPSFWSNLKSFADSIFSTWRK